MYQEIKSYDEFFQVKQEPAVLAYFSTSACSVCKVLKPKLQHLIETKFPKIKLVYIKSDELPDVAAQNQIFTAPTILVYFNGQETIRKSRNIGLLELEQEIGRLYTMMFD